MFLRRSAAALAAATVLCGTAAPAALADDGTAASPASGGRAQSGERASSGTAASVAAASGTSSPGAKLPDGLYGTSAPTYDGVWRQSVALLALHAAGAVPAEKAVDWLAGQQCADGSFTAYRPRPSQQCDAKKTPSDTNATSLAVQALAALGGRDDAVRKGADWLKSVQNADGGWGFNAGGRTDGNSTSVAVGALAAAGEQPGAVRKKKGADTPYDALGSLQIGCGTGGAEDGKGDGKQRGAFAYQPGKGGELAANDDATAAASLAELGEGLLVKPLGESSEDRPLTQAGCGKGKRSPEARADAGAAYLAGVMKKNGGHLNSVMPGAEGQPDYANTADAVIALAAGGHTTAARDSLEWLGRNLGKWDKAKKDPAALGTLMLAVHATGGDPGSLGGVDLLKRLTATGPAPKELPDASASQGGDGDGGNTVLTWSLIGAGLAAGAGIGFLISGRRKRKGL